MYVPFVRMNNSVFRESISFYTIACLFTLSLCISMYGEEESIDRWSVSFYHKTL
jgi:hypothetical protein